MSCVVPQGHVGDGRVVVLVVVAVVLVVFVRVTVEVQRYEVSVMRNDVVTVATGWAALVSY